MQSPLISVVLATRNAMPHLKIAIDSLKRQTYKNFELLVQDGASTDGTVDYVHSIVDWPRLDFESAPDTGMNQGYNRALERCKGDLVYFIAADERLFDHSLETAVSWFSDNPSAAVIYGGQMLIDRNGAEVQRCFPAPFDLLEVIQCKLVPPWAASIFNRKVLELEDLRSDESMTSCADYDLWLRLGSRFESKIHMRRELFGFALADRRSWGFRTESYRQFCEDKCFALDRWLAREGRGRLAESVRAAAKSGIHLWGAEQILGIDGDIALAFELVREAALIHPRSQRLLEVLGKFPTADVEALIKIAPGLTHSLESLMQKRGLSKPPSNARPEPGAIDLAFLSCFPVWESRIEDRRSHLRLHGGTSEWGYAAQARPNASFAATADNDYFIKVRLKVLSGAIGVCVMNNDQLVEEYIFTPPDDEIACSSPVGQMANFSLILRNAGAANSVAEIYDLCLLSSPKPASPSVNTRCYEELAMSNDAKTIPLVEPWFPLSYADDVKKQVLSGFLGPGSRTEEFSDGIAKYIGAEQCLLTVSGTVALSVAAIAVGLKPGDEILVPAYGVISVINAFACVGLKPRLVDVELSTGSISARNVELSISENTRAVCFVNFSGYTGPELIKVKQLCEKYNLPLIEDAACALGHSYQGRFAGNFGTVGTFSFSIPKVLTTGQGGALVTSDVNLFARAAAYIDQGDLEWRKTNLNRAIGTNLRYTDIQATFGLAQLRDLDERLALRRASYNALRAELGNYLFSVPAEQAPLHNIVFTREPENLLSHLKNSGIAAVRPYRTLSQHPAYEHLADKSYPNSDYWTESALYLPFGMALTPDKARRIANEVYASRVKLEVCSEVQASSSG